jgi:hypothetical protein
MTPQRVRLVTVKTNLPPSTCLGIWIVREVQKLGLRILRCLLSIRIQSRKIAFEGRLHRMLRTYERGASGVSTIASSGLDGKIVVWGVGRSNLEGRMGGLHLHH